jgi:hypothetical protein
MDKKKQYHVGVRAVVIQTRLVEAENPEQAKDFAKNGGGFLVDDEFSHDLDPELWTVEECPPWICEVAIARNDNTWQTTFLTIPGGMDEVYVEGEAERVVEKWLNSIGMEVSFIKCVHYRHAEEGEEIPTLEPVKG